MKRTMILGLMLTLATSAYAYPALNVELVFPTSTTWELWGNLLENTGGLAGIVIEVSGIETKESKLPVGFAFDANHICTQVGFAVGADMVTNNPDTWQLFKAQDPQIPAGMLYEVGVTATSEPITTWPGADLFLPPEGMSFGMPVLMYQGTRAAGASMAVNYGYGHSGATVFTQVGGTNLIEIPVIAEPATLALLTLGGLTALRRRR